MGELSDRIASYSSTPANPYKREISPLQHAAWERGYQVAREEAWKRTERMVEAIISGKPLWNNPRT
jgi:hypothetical protein